MRPTKCLVLERFKPIEHSLDIYSKNIRCVTVYKDEREKRTEQYYYIKNHMSKISQ